MALATVEELAKQLAFTRAPTADENAALQLLLDAATADLATESGRNFTAQPAADGDAPVAKSFTTYMGTHLRIEGDLRRTPAPTVELGPGAVLALNTGYALEGMQEQLPYATHIDLQPAWGRYSWPGGNDDLTITGWWGWREDDPMWPSAKRACLSLAARMHAEKGARWADSVQTAEGGAFTYLRQIPGSVQSFIDRIKVPRVALV